MKKILILVFTLFLISCTSSEIVSISINSSTFVTGASPVLNQPNYSRKFGNYEDYQAALDTEFQIPSNRRIYDAVFFEESDLIVVITRVHGNSNQSMFRLVNVYKQRHTIYVSIQITNPSNNQEPFANTTTNYCYLIAVDKMENLTVQLRTH